MATGSLSDCRKTIEYVTFAKSYICQICNQGWYTETIRQKTIVMKTSMHIQVILNFLNWLYQRLRTKLDNLSKYQGPLFFVGSNMQNNCMRIHNPDPETPCWQNPDKAKLVLAPRLLCSLAKYLCSQLVSKLVLHKIFLHTYLLYARLYNVSRSLLSCIYIKQPIPSIVL